MSKNKPKDLFHDKHQSPIDTLVLILVIINVIILQFAFVSDEKSYLLLVVTLPVLLVSVIYQIQQKHVFQHPKQGLQTHKGEKAREKSIN